MPVAGNVQLGYKDQAWFDANPTLVLLVGQMVFLENTNHYKVGDGTAQLSVLSFSYVFDFIVMRSPGGVLYKHITGDDGQWFNIGEVFTP